MIKSLRARLVSAFIGLAVLPILLAGIFLSYMSTKSMHNVASRHLQVEASRISIAAEDHLRELEKMLELTFRTHSFLSMNRLEQKQILDALLSYENRFDALTLLDNKGKVLIRSHRTRVMLDDATPDHSGDRAFQQATALNATYMSPTWFNDITGEPQMTIAMPMLSLQTGQMQHVLLGTVRLKKIWDLLATLSHADHTVFIVDDNGSIVAHPDPSVVLSGNKFHPLTDSSGNAITVSGDKVVRATELIRFGSQTLNIVAEQPFDKAMAFSRNIPLIIGTVIIFALFIAVCLSFLIIRNILRPLQRLTTVSRDIEQGNLNLFVEEASDVELKELARTLNSMTTRLRMTIEDLEGKVEERNHEIREREKIEKELNNSRATLRQILDTIPQAIFWKDAESVYMGCNRVFAAAVGFDNPEKVKGKTDFELPWPQAEAEVYRRDDKEVISGKNIKLHIIEPLQQADGTRLQIDTTKVPLVDEQGKVYGVLGVYEDITEHKKAEEERENLQKQLRQAQKMEAIGTLAGGIAHDFNNILSIIFGYTDLAMEENDPDKIHQDLAEVKRGAERAKSLVQQILTFSRKTEQDKKPLQVSLLIKEALKMLRASIPTTIEIRQEINSDSTVLADSTQVHQIIMNLCTNAYHAMRETGGILAVSLNDVEIGVDDYRHASLKPGRYLKFEVCDNGNGIEPQLIDKIFEPYFTTKKPGEGTGMGLAVVHGIVVGHHGHITVYSEQGKGTCFHVYLPLIDEKTVDVPTEIEPENIHGNGERIMFVDDEETIRKLADKILSMNGYQVTTFSNAVHAIEIFMKQKDQYDLVVTDMTMPYMTGAELTQKILAIRPEIPIILCTGQSELINREKAFAMGVCNYLEKPVGTQQILKAVRTAMKKNSNLS